MISPPYTKEQSIGFYKEADAILERLRNDALSVMNELDILYGNRRKTLKQKMMAKTYVSTAMQLTRQSLHVFTANENFLLLSCLGTRSLIEHEINAKYVFFHPNHHRDNAWLEKQAKSYWKITRVRKEGKARLGGVSIFQRAKEVRRMGAYRHNFAILTGIAHNTAASATLIKDQSLYNSVVWIGLHTILLLDNTIDFVASFHDIQRDKTIEDDIKQIVALYK